jgi:ABC-type transport system involved in multi-copper enzyme maturation permease subunit
MIRFAWLQSRTQNLVALAGLVVLAITLAVTGPHLVHLYDTTVANCQTRGDCPAVTAQFLRHDAFLETWLGFLVTAIPAVIGIFWGAPLVARELETGTFRLVWTQTVTRTRWLAVKVAVMGLATMAVAGLLTLMITWWAGPFAKINKNIYSIFDQRDIVPVGYAAFAFALGVTVGLLIRRTLPAMATTLALFVTARLAFLHLVEPHLIAPSHLSVALDPTSISGLEIINGGPPILTANPPTIPNAWIYSTRIVDNAGHALAPQTVGAACPNLGAPAGPAGGGSAPVPHDVQGAMQSCVEKLGGTYHLVVTYQPPSHYWTFQWDVLGAFLAAAAVLVGIAFWSVRRVS